MGGWACYGAGHSPPPGKEEVLQAEEMMIGMMIVRVQGPFQSAKPRGAAQQDYLAAEMQKEYSLHHAHALGIRFHRMNGTE